METIIKFIRILYPLGFGAALIYASIAVSTKALESSTIVSALVPLATLLLDPFFLSEWKVPLARGVFFGAGAFCLLYAAFRDYSEFFPERFDLDIFFDLQGLVQALDRFSPDELRSLKPAGQWKAARTTYFEDLNRSLREQELGFQFSPGKDGTTGTGEAIFKLKKSRQWGGIGAQQYRIAEGRGTLTFHSGHDASGEPPQLHTEYRLIQKQAATVDVGLKNILLQRSVIIRPEFEQIIMLSPTRRTPHPIPVTAATKIVLWPRFIIHETVYLIFEPHRGYVPIGYARYSAQ